MTWFPVGWAPVWQGAACDDGLPDVRDDVDHTRQVCPTDADGHHSQPGKGRVLTDLRNTWNELKGSWQMRESILRLTLHVPHAFCQCKHHFKFNLGMVLVILAHQSWFLLSEFL